MKSGEIRYCACGCGEPAKRVYSGNRFKSWRSYATGHAPNERLSIRVPDSATDLSYAAGIIDGEGCIYARVHIVKTGNVSTFLQLQLTMCSESVVGWFAQKFGGDVYVSQPPSLNRRTRFIWQIRGRQVGQVLRAIHPYLIEKRQRAELGIQLSELLGQSKPGKNRKIPQEEMDRRSNLAAQIKAFNQNLRSEDAVQ